MPDIEWKYVNTAGSTTISEPCLVKGIYINEPPTTNASVSDDSQKVFTIPSGAAIGNAYNGAPTRFETSLVINAGGGDITVLYVKLREAHA